MKVSKKSVIENAAHYAPLYGGRIVDRVAPAHSLYERCYISVKNLKADRVDEYKATIIPRYVHRVASAWHGGQGSALYAILCNEYIDAVPSDMIRQSIEELAMEIAGITVRAAQLDKWTPASRVKEITIAGEWLQARLDEIMAIESVK